MPIEGMAFKRCALEHPDFIDAVNAYRPDVVAHAAGSASVGYSFQEPREDFLKAVETWGAVLDAVRKADVKPLVIFPVSYTHLRAHETVLDLVCRLLLEKKKDSNTYMIILIIHQLAISHARD